VPGWQPEPLHRLRAQILDSSQGEGFLAVEEVVQAAVADAGAFEHHCRTGRLKPTLTQQPKVKRQAQGDDLINQSL
jgi:hypothetical protein